MAAKGLYINSTEQGFTVRGVNNNFFPDNATLAYPANSVILIIDESDMATFRSASNYDVLFSALIKDININEERVTKDNIIETFNEAANKPSGGGGNPDAFTSVEYDGTKSLIFYNDKGDEVANVDVTPFIKDGMVSNVEILNGNLVITFNTDSGKQPITIPLTDIFNPNNYYNKTESDSRFASQTVVNQEIAARIQGDADINTALGTKADKSDTYTKSQIDALIPDTSDFVSKSEYNPKEVAIAEALTDLNENKADKTEIPDVSTLATKTELNAKQDTLISGTNIKTVNNQSILGEGNIEIQGGGMDEDTELLISSALVDLNDRKIDATEVKENYQKKGDYATNAKVDTKANISDVPTNEDYEEAQKITSWSLNDLNAKFGGVRLQIITQSDYEALATKDNNTLYVIRTD